MGHAFCWIGRPNSVQISLDEVSTLHSVTADSLKVLWTQLDASTSALGIDYDFI
jgi:hypothetical protein